MHGEGFFPLLQAIPSGNSSYSLWNVMGVRGSADINDNQAVVNAMNKGRAKSSTLSPFLRHLIWIAACHQFIIRAAHIPDYHNQITDSLSQFNFQKFRTLAPGGDTHSTPLLSFLRDGLSLNHPLSYLPPISVDLALQAFAPRTLQSYWTTWSFLKHFHSSHSLSFPSLDTLTLSSLITYAHTVQKIKISTIKVYLSSIRFF